MLKVILPLVLLMGFTACELNEEELLKSIVGTAEEVPLGTYESQCVLISEGAYSKFVIELENGSYTIQESHYSNIECSLSEVIDPVSDLISADLPGPDLGSGFSFFGATDGKKVPYYYKDGEFVLGEPQESLPSGEDDFTGFQEDLEAGRIAVYTRL